MNEQTLAWLNFASAALVGIVALVLALETPAVPWLRIKRWLLGVTGACGLGVAVSAAKLMAFDAYSASGALWQLSAAATGLRFAMASVLLWELGDLAKTKRHGPMTA